MEWYKDRRLQLALAGVLALLGLSAWAVLSLRYDSGPSDLPERASGPGLVVQTGRDDDIHLDPARPLRCYVNGQSVGDLPLADCARRNGVAPGALSVGVGPGGPVGGGAAAADSAMPADTAATSAATTDADESAAQPPGDPAAASPEH